MKQLWKHCFDRRTLLAGLAVCMAVNAILLIGQLENREVISFFNKMAGESVSVESVSDWFEENYTGENKEGYLEAMEPYLSAAPMLYDHTAGADLAFSYQMEKKVGGEALAFAGKEYEKIDRKIQTYAGKKDNTLFVPGNLGFYHYFTRVILLTVAIEGVLLAFAVSVRAFKLEHSIRAEQTVYATKMGRSLQIRKLFVLTAGSEALFTVLLAGTLLLFEAVYPSRNLFKTQISSGMVLDGNAICVSWVPVSIFQYVGIFYLITLLLVAFAVAYAFILSNVFSGSHTVLLAGSAGVAVIELIESLIPRDSALLYVAFMNPVHLLMEAGHWLISGSTFLSPQNYELYTILIWSGIFAAAGWASSRYWKRKEIFR